MSLVGVEAPPKTFVTWEGAIFFNAIFTGEVAPERRLKTLFNNRLGNVHPLENDNCHLVYARFV